MKKYNERLKELREDRDVTQQYVADLLKTTRSYYGQYERGVRPLPMEHLITLCKFYGVSADYILGLPENMPFPKR
ncbi:MAG TPA: transcriptional regulator [Ruminococcaceae bacterium]|nr:transcriptional regulator [Oscillospiraceae bacterium]